MVEGGCKRGRGSASSSVYCLRMSLSSVLLQYLLQTLVFDFAFENLRLSLSRIMVCGFLFVTLIHTKKVLFISRNVLKISFNTEDQVEYVLYCFI